MNREELKIFVENLPTIQKIEQEAGLAQGYLSKIISGQRSLTEKTTQKLLPVLQKYGYEKTKIVNKKNI